MDRTLIAKCILNIVVDDCEYRFGWSVDVAGLESGRSVILSITTPQTTFTLHQDHGGNDLDAE